MFICTFRYKPEHVACHLCTEYNRKRGCTAQGCPWLAERIEAGVVGYYRKARDEMRELLAVKANVDHIMGQDERGSAQEKEHGQR